MRELQRSTKDMYLDIRIASPHCVLPGAEPFFGPDPLPLMFIRAPRITRVGPEVDVLVTVEGEPVLVRSNNFFGATCHPELTSDIRVHQAIFC